MSTTVPVCALRLIVGVERESTSQHPNTVQSSCRLAKLGQYNKCIHHTGPEKETNRKHTTKSTCSLVLLIHVQPCTGFNATSASTPPTGKHDKNVRSESTKRKSFSPHRGVLATLKTCKQLSQPVPRAKKKTPQTPVAFFCFPTPSTRPTHRTRSCSSNL